MDDIDALAHLYKNLYDSKAEILVMNSKKFYQNTNKYSVEKHYYDIGKNYGMRQLLEQNLYVACAWDKIIKREFLSVNKLKFVEDQLSEDVEWCADYCCVIHEWIILMSHFIVIDSKILYQSRQMWELKICKI